MLKRAARCDITKAFWAIEDTLLAKGTATPAKITLRPEAWFQSPVGIGKDTVVDTSIRRSKSANPDKFTLDWPAMASGEVPESVRMQLAPWLPVGSLTAELHSALLYNEGDKFDLHRDSKKGDNHLVTLTVEVTEGDGKYEGGVVEILPAGAVGAMRMYSDKLDDEVTVVNPNRGALLPWNSSGNGSWAAWYNNTFHRVTELTKGSRMTATYNIFVSPEAAAAPKFDLPASDPSTVAVDKLCAELTADIYENDKKKGPLVFLCACKYLMHPTKALSPVFLIGRDRLMYEALTRVFNCEPILAESEIEYVSGEECDSESGIVLTAPKLPDARLVFETDDDGEFGMIFNSEEDIRKHLFRTFCQEEVDRFGNHGQDGVERFSRTAMVVLCDKTPTRKRKRSQQK
ncbi:hypothetical protein DIPPA_31155 [Diplonema papillatum]|nr:hypothetical protein DIPPA_31155 [Diplonema papillatum]